MARNELPEMIAVIRNGVFSIEPGYVMGWTPEDSDPINGPSAKDDALDHELVQQLESLSTQSIGRINRRTVKDRDLIKLKWTIRRLNELSGFQRFTLSISDSLVSIRRHDAPKQKTEKQSVTQRDQSQLTACPICNKVRRNKSGQIVNDTFDFQSELKEMGYPRWNHNAHWECFHKYAFRRIKE